ncbi:THO complex subunit 1-like [Sinocyclocheilus grahami]|uniref:THO complex subunit 1-like n=1 Tax=Sinocyclocheilus grahami TaxID=75366 RepID=UPI0007AD5BF4|nr:PREDICTED: THO complex subunit 1-like [Sinocyclocheilus grahami]
MSPPSLFDFTEARDIFTAAAKSAVDIRSCKPLTNAFSQLPGNETEKKATLDQALRGVLEEQIVKQKVDVGDFLSLIYISVDGVTEGICSATAPFLLLGDVLDCLPLDQCDKIFSFVEENVSTWKSNDILGPQVSCFNVPSIVFSVQYSDETLAVFKSFKLDDMQASKRKLEEMRTAAGDHVYFAKFLTSEKLMDLQLSDSNFRRHILLQYLILFQYLKGQVKFKSSSCVLNDDQSLWIEDTTKLVYQLLRETPPDGDKFALMFEHILNTEENWNSWKNEGCPSFVKERPAKTKPIRPSIQSKAVTNSQMDEIAAKLGSQWKTLADHLEMSEKEIRVIESDSEDVELQAKMLLVAWQDREGTQATMESLVTALNSAGFSNITEGLSET